MGNKVTKYALHINAQRKKRKNKKDSNKILIPKKRGFANYLSHLKTCALHGDINNLYSTHTNNPCLRQNCMGNLLSLTCSSLKLKKNNLHKLIQL